MEKTVYVLYLMEAPDSHNNHHSTRDFGIDRKRKETISDYRLWAVSCARGTLQGHASISVRLID